jgi:response regulator RpfG family c-di-GMP phosphodiesterase
MGFSSQNTDTILMLDDEFDIMNIFTLALEQQGFHVVGFTEPLLALEHFQENSEQYGLVISDIRMPVMDGYEFIKKVKEIKPNVKVFFMSALLSDDIQFRTGLSLVKVDEYIEKPISVNDFIRMVKKYFLTSGDLKHHS